MSANSSQIGIIALIGLLTFTLLHGIYKYGIKNIIIFFLITCLISWLTESLSVKTGFPFGQYTYSEILGPQLGKVPFSIMPIYFFTGYLAWTMAKLFLGNFTRNISKQNIFLIPIIATIIMVVWDICLDPIRSTVEGMWTWQNPGFYFGVPLSNFFGWFLTVYLIFQSFALLIYKSRVNKDRNYSKIYWLLIPLVYIGQGIEFLIHPFFQSENQIIYWSILVITMLTMISIAILCIITISKYYKILNSKINR